MDKNPDDGKTGSRTGVRIAAVAIVILLLCMLVFLLVGKKGQKPLSPVLERKTGQVAVAPTDSAQVAKAKVDSMRRADSTRTKATVDSVRRAIAARIAKATVDSVRRADSTRVAKAIADSVRRSDSVETARAAADSARVKAARDSATLLVTNTASVDCANDTAAPWVYLEPAGGLHYGAVSVKFVANKKCSIMWRVEPDTVWRTYDNNGYAVEKTMTIAFKAVDLCGHSMNERREYYEIDRSTPSNSCPQGMDLAKIGAMRYCVDRYEWPNRKGVVPRSYVTFYQARDSCFTKGKRLCTSEEWSLACSGPYSWNYPYGKEYEPRACITSDTAAGPSGSKPECRAFFGSFDMAGNLMEWTSTSARDNPSYYNVMGGFWQSGIRSGCFDIRYSYFPQNRHNPVGFRCCKDVPAEGK